ncbi:hypothetical protein Tco_1216991 [Tanacetum coccineum]
MISTGSSIKLSLSRAEALSLGDGLREFVQIGISIKLVMWKIDTFPSLQALSDLYYLFYGFMDYLWSRQLDISNFGLEDRKILPVESFVVPVIQMASEILLNPLEHVPSRRTSYALSIPRRLELHKASVLAVGMLTLGLFPSCTSSFPEILHDTDLEITFGEIGI